MLLGVAFLVHIRAEKHASENPEKDQQESINNLVDELSDRALQALPYHNADLEETTLGKPCQIAAPKVSPPTFGSTMGMARDVTSNAIRGTRKIPSKYELPKGRFFGGNPMNRGREIIVDEPVARCNNIEELEILGARPPSGVRAFRLKRGKGQVIVVNPRAWTAKSKRMARKRGIVLMRKVPQVPDARRQINMMMNRLERETRTPFKLMTLVKERAQEWAKEDAIRMQQEEVEKAKKKAEREAKRAEEEAAAEAEERAAEGGEGGADPV